MSGSPSENTRSRAAGATSGDAPITIDDLARMINTRLDIIDTRLDIIDTRLDIIDTRLDIIDSRLADNTASIATINTRLDTLDTRLTSLEAEVAIKSRSSSPLPSPTARALPTLPSQELPAAIQELATTPTTTAVPVSEAYDDNKPVVAKPFAKVEPKADGPVTTQEVMQDIPVLFNGMASPREKFFDTQDGTCLYRTEWEEARTRELPRNNFKVPTQYWARHTVPYLKDAVWRGFGPPTSSVSHFGLMVA